jgi:hypothetical protein
MDEFELLCGGGTSIDAVPALFDPIRVERLLDVCEAAWRFEMLDARVMELKPAVNQKSRFAHRAAPFRLRRNDAAECELKTHRKTF